MGAVTSVTDIDIGVGRYGLRTFKPAMVRDFPHLVSVSQDPIPEIDPRFNVKREWRDLLSETHPVSWEDGTCRAVCVRYRRALGDVDYHEAPDKRCGCGVYALDDLRNLYAEYRQHTMSVVAVVSASGRTVECANGFRTAFARVVAYWVLDHRRRCQCRLCAARLTSVRGFKPSELWGDSFPYVACCQAQFKDAERWDEPDEMALHFGLKATPIAPPVGTYRRTFDGRAMTVLTSTPGHFEFEIPLG